MSFVRVALAANHGRISPVLDVARRLLLVDFEHHHEIARREIFMEEISSTEPLRYLAEYQIDVLICGALSQPLQAALLAAGLQVIAHRCGCIDEIIAAYANRQLDAGTFRMPGCRTPHCPCRRRQRRAAHRNHPGGAQP